LGGHLPLTNSSFMKRFIVALIVASAFTAFAGHAIATPASEKKVVAALEQQWIQAFWENNPKLLEQILASTWVQTDADGILSGKSHEMADTKETKWTSLKNIGMKITLYGDTAIVTGIFKGKGTASWGAVDDHYRFTDTWVKMPRGNWQCVATQLTTVAK
jgi:Domain of unknown function (DUF4440)